MEDECEDECSDDSDRYRSDESDPEEVHTQPYLHNVTRSNVALCFLVSMQIVTGSRRGADRDGGGEGGEEEAGISDILMNVSITL